MTVSVIVMIQNATVVVMINKSSLHLISYPFCLGFRDRLVVVSVWVRELCGFVLFCFVLFLVLCLGWRLLSRYFSPAAGPTRCWIPDGMYFF